MVYGCEIVVPYTLCNFFWNTLYIVDRPTNDRRSLIWKISHGHMSATGHTLHFMSSSCYVLGKNFQARRIGNSDPDQIQDTRWELDLLQKGG